MALLRHRAQKSPPVPCTFVIVELLSRVDSFVTSWTVSCQVPLSMGFSRQEHWSGLLSLPPGDLPNPGIKPSSFELDQSLRSPVLADGFFTTSTTLEALWVPLNRNYTL